MQDELKQKLAQLKQVLSESNQFDEEDRKLLAQLDEDIQAALSTGESDDSLTGRIEQQAIEFDTQHPSTSAVLRDIMDVLGKMGI